MVIIVIIASVPLPGFKILNFSRPILEIGNFKKHLLPNLGSNLKIRGDLRSYIYDR